MSSSSTTTVRLDSPEAAIAEIAAGRPVVVIDDENRENEGDLIVAADAVTPELVAFFVRHTSGVLCVSMEPERLDSLGIPLMTSRNTESMGTAFTVSVDAAEGVTTGISASDRATTIRLLAGAAEQPSELAQPGHVFPLRCRPGGVLVRPGHTEAAVDLARLGGRHPSGLIAELVDDDDGSMLRGERLREFADTHGFLLISIADLITYRRRTEQLVDRVASTRLPTQHGEFRAIAYHSRMDGLSHVALVYGDVERAAPGTEALVRLHSECLTGDVFGSLRCDCGEQLAAAMRAVVAAGSGVVVYLRGHEGRGIGLASKLEAYALQDNGFDTVDANLELGLPADARDYWVGAQILRDLGVTKVRLLTNNPAKLVGLQTYGVESVEAVGLVVPTNADNVTYLDTKRDRLGHLLPSDRLAEAKLSETRGIR